MKRPRPVLTSSGIAGAVTSIVGVLAFLGYKDEAAHLSAASTTIASVVLGGLVLGSHLLAAVHGQQKVTPLTDPLDKDGIPLMPADMLAAPALQIVTPPGVAPPGRPLVVRPEADVVADLVAKYGLPHDLGAPGALEIEQVD